MNLMMLDLSTREGAVASVPQFRNIEINDPEKGKICIYADQTVQFLVNSYYMIAGTRKKVRMVSKGDRKEVIYVW